MCSVRHPDTFTDVIFEELTFTEINDNALVTFDRLSARDDCRNMLAMILKIISTHDSLKSSIIKMYVFLVGLKIIMKKILLILMK